MTCLQQNIALLNFDSYFWGMKKWYLFFIGIFISLFAPAQTDTLTNAPFADLKYVEVLQDKSYSFEQILQDSSLFFSQTPLLQDFKSCEYYWLKIQIYNPSAYSQPYFLKILPQLENTVYSFDEETQAWKSQKVGLSVATSTRLYGTIPFTFQAKKQTTIYIKLKTSALSAYSFTTKARVYLQTAQYYADKNQFAYIVWIATLAVMLMFFIYNAYIYFIFKDNTYLYYLVIVIGGMMYITGLNWFLNVLSPLRIFNIEMKVDGNVYFFDLNSLVRDTGIIVVITGFIQLTRSYLETKTRLPYWDKVLNYIKLAFISINVLNIFSTISGIYYTNNYITFPENMATVGIILLLVWVGIVSYRKQFKPAKYFLLANILPLSIMLIIATYFALYRFHNSVIELFPNLAIISQTLSFAIALVARINLLKEELKNRQLEAEILKTEKERILLKNEVEKRALQRDFSRQLIQTQESEKQRISQELHDSIGQNILFIKNQLTKNNTQNHLSPIIETVNDTIEEVRNISKDLYPNQLEKYGLTATVETLCEKVAESTGIFMSADFQDTEKYLSKETKIHVYRIIQESVNNVIKHAAATALRVTAEKQADNIRYLIQDNGKGFDKAILAKKQQRSFGLLGMEERVKMLGGKLEVESRIAEGTKLIFTVSSEGH